MPYLDPVKDLAVVTVSQGYDAAAFSILLASGEGSKLPDPAFDGAFDVAWINWTDFPNAHDDPNYEQVRVTGRSGDTLTVTRGVNGFTAKTHNAAGKTYVMFQGLFKAGRDKLETRIGYAPAFRARLTADQTGVVPNTDTKLQLATEDFDETAEYDATTNYRFTASKPCLLAVAIAVRVDSLADGDQVFAKLYKNGVEYSQMVNRSPVAGSASARVNLSDTIKLVSSNYIEAFCRHDSSANRTVNTVSTWFTATAQPVLS